MKLLRYLFPRRARIHPALLQSMAEAVSSMGADPELTGPRREPSGTKPLSEAQETQMTRVIALLKRQGTITTIEANKAGGTVDARKMFTRMRKLGLLYPASDPKGFRWADNAHNGGRHKVHLLVKGAA